MRQPSLSPLCYVFTSQLDLSGNTLCGINPYYVNEDTYTAEGIKAIANALKGNASMTRLDVRHNLIGEEGKAALHEAIEGRSGFELLL